VTSHIVTPVNVEREIIRLCECCERVITEIAKRARAAAEADAEYKKVHAQAILKSEGTVSEREAHAALATQDQYRDRRIAEALLLAAQEAGRNYRAQLDALRSINANVRNAAGLSG
jgi:ribosomal protein S18 acetylase RimI-like enzyme